MPDRIGRHAGSCAAERAIECMRATGVGRDRYDAVRKSGADQCEVAGVEVADAADRVRGYKEYLEYEEYAEVG